MNKEIEISTEDVSVIFNKIYKKLKWYKYVFSYSNIKYNVIPSCYNCHKIAVFRKPAHEAFRHGEVKICRKCLAKVRLKAKQPRRYNSIWDNNGYNNDGP